MEVLTQYHLSNVHPDARIGKNVHISPFVTIEADVEIGDNTWIGPNVCILDGTRLGENCKIFPGAVLGAAPQDLKFRGEQSLLEIGNHVTIREYCTLNRGTEANWTTTIKDHCLLMAYVHVAHDCILEEHVILANNVTLAGHIHIGKYAILGGLSAVHQFVNIGDHAMVGGGSLVRKDVPPYIKAAREPISYAGINGIGLKRRGFSPESIKSIQDAYRYLFVKGYNTSQALELIDQNIPSSLEKSKIIDFVRSSERGIMKGFRQLYTNGSKD
ncbi:MAG: acyl-ACP--UDP-N-acetylglucosamine O-acyltransferase [Saprospiraceae bacterium]|jgi:UDP-N-acetylglucosamine acyltransferase|nr:acyl-ACP--UDP-N-acetylglucosamine O-acyltransferase [Saprospiraceae bacterium]MBK6480319.1 acyl-ACP--UDP-N-acetylglucosamine O-acyltransferase [Saprospiraceae bacterium]MBK6814825.1 acyl-ACP--UDP-N-acetylglucosamine O-acyltransferase [Saprospiraceae bacterium]MBK7371863.1 acyl-ACP--UDP-N-acetylglucosamine O-acyltransferase [Saprospiraceae bacterium]MBK7435669.1 acyl-ACP--UDP-N-acetylglucosamine O-acyltransferase [Saprospiraceae bacterium]